MLAVSSRYVCNREDAEDVVHDALIKIITSIHEFKPKFEGALKAWIIRITVNTALNHLRSKSQYKLEKSYISDVEMITESSLNQSSELPRKIEPETALKLINELPEGYRSVLNLYVFERFTHGEIASKLNISVSTSKSQLSKARALLRKKVMKLKKLYQTIEK